MLVELISKNAGQGQEHWRYRPSPSKVGHCVRALTYDAIGVPPDPFPDRTILVFADGNWHEELIKDHIRKTVFRLTEWKGKNQRVQIADINGYKMSGEVDGILEDPTGQMYLLEVKSINHFGFERLDKEPQEDHRRQTNLYLHGLAEAGFKAGKAIILYKSKNTSAMKEFVIEYDENQALSDIEMFRQIDRWAKESKVPPRPYGPEDWQCNYCRWNKTCYKNYVDEIGKLSADVALDEELATTARYFNELGAQIHEQEKERGGLKAILKEALTTAHAKSGRAGEYLISVSVQERDQIDKALVPPEAVKKVISERFTVKKITKEAS